MVRERASGRVTNQWRMVGQVAAYERWSPILSTHYSTAEAARDSNCLHLHKSIDLPDLLRCPAVSIHLWMHAYSKLQCPQAELWVADLVCPSLRSLFTKGPRRTPLTGQVRLANIHFVALYWIVNDIPSCVPSVIIPCYLSCASVLLWMYCLLWTGMEKVRPIIYLRNDR